MPRAGPTIEAFMRIIASPLHVSGPTRNSRCSGIAARHFAAVAGAVASRPGGDSLSYGSPMWLAVAFSAGGSGGRKSPELPAHVGILSTCWQHAGIDSQVPRPTTAKQERSPGSEAGARLGFVVTVTVTI